MLSSSQLDIYFVLFHVLTEILLDDSYVYEHMLYH